MRMSDWSSDVCSSDLGVPAAGARAMNGVNQWLRAQGKADAALQGMATTFTAAILRGRRAHVLHVGDSRAYHYSNGRLVRLTSDHVLPQPDLRHVLYRAVGIEDLIRLDHASVELAVQIGRATVLTPVTNAHLV